jgi:hypothetical protein
LSFFDEADEPSATPRPPRSRRPSGTGDRPPGDQQTILVRRAIAAVVLLVVVILIVVGVHSCQVSARNSALHDYANNVSSVITSSNQTSSQLFQQLTHTSGSNGSNIAEQLATTKLAAMDQLKKARGFDVPDEMKAAQQNLLLALQMRVDGIASIGQNIQQALGTTTSRDAVTTIAAEMARLYSSDVVYKDYMIPLMIGGLKSAGISLAGVPIQKGQFVPDVQWVLPAFVTSKLGASVPSSTGKPTPGVHGHSLDSVSVQGSTLQTGSTNTIPASPPPTFTFHYTNGGQNDEHNVVMKVSVSGTSITGQTVVPVTTKGQSGTADVKLSSSPPAGNYTLTATINGVLGETNKSNNTLTFPVTFQ